MSKTATIRARTEPKLKKDVEIIFEKLGLSSTEAINIFYKQVRLRKGIPFEVRIPNKVTKRTFEQTDKRKGLKSFNTVDELFKDLDSK
jgi:DNA-damage-inducible protein J